jgi:dihydropyrimidine dehydrogenase (NAD+) subunit PreA
MVPCQEEAWKAILPMVEDTGCDGVELNFGCPHGMSERGMGSAVGQVPEYIEMVTRWCKHYTKLPVIVKLTPNVADIKPPALAAHRGGADAVSLINTINSVMGVDLDSLLIVPSTGGQGSHGGYCGPGGQADRAEHGRRDRARAGDGRPADLGHRRHHDLEGRGRVHRARLRQRADLHRGDDLRLQDRAGPLRRPLGIPRREGHGDIDALRGRAVPSIVDWNQLNLNHVEKARIDQSLCIQCGRCHIVCEDTSHQAISATMNGKRHFEVMDDECVGCNLCVSVCPVPDCITMHALPAGAVDPRTGQVVSGEYANWTTHPEQPGARLTGRCAIRPWLPRRAPTTVDVQQVSVVYPAREHTVTALDKVSLTIARASSSR